MSYKRRKIIDNSLKLTTFLSSFSMLPCFLAINSLFYAQEKPSQDIPPRYELVKDWPRLRSPIKMGQPAGLGINSEDNIVVFHRGGAITDPVPNTLIPNNTILVLDTETGNVLDAWGANSFCVPHGLTVDHEDNIWVTDVALQQVFKFNPRGKLLMKLGVAREPGDDELHFNKPTDVAVAADGSFYVSDGYGNSRIVKFSPTGKHLYQWGTKGIEKGQFNLPHSVDIDENGNVIVADRENARIQKFDANGNFLAEWKSGSGATVYAVKVDVENHSLLAVDYLVKNDTLILGSNISHFGADLILDGQFGREGAYDGPVCRYHDIELDGNKNIYVADLLNKMVQKFRPVENEKP